MTATDNALELQLETQTRRLIEEFHGVVAPEAVREEVARAFEDHRSARIWTYVPIFTYRAARAALHRLAQPSARRA